MRLKKTNPMIRAISTSLYAVEDPIFSRIELEKSELTSECQNNSGKNPQNSDIVLLHIFLTILNVFGHFRYCFYILI